MNNTGQSIITVARQFVGTLETVQNRSWSSYQQPLLDLMIPTGWQPGNQYCAAFATGCWLKVYNQFDLSFDLSLNPVAVTNWEQFETIFLPHLTDIPSLGAMYFIRHNNDVGHTGLISNINTVLTCIEGNVPHQFYDGIKEGIYERPLTVPLTSRHYGYLNPIDIKVDNRSE